MSTEPNREAGLDPAVTVGEIRRLNAVRGTELLDTPPEEAFDRLTRIAAELVEAPVTFISIVDEHRDFYKSCYGFDATLSESREIRGTTFCHYAITSSEPLVINDTKAHPVYREVPTVRSLGVAAYLGIPLKLPGGEIIGSFCAIDFEPRAWSDRDVRVLSELAGSALREIELRLAVRLARQEALEAEKARSLAAMREAEVRGRHELILEATADGIFGLDGNGLVTFMNQAAAQILGWSREELLGTDQHQRVHHSRPDGSAYPAAECPIRQSILDGTTRKSDAEVFFRQDGTPVPIEFTARPIVEGEPSAGSVVTFRDISERLESQERERALADERTARASAEAAGKAREEFFAVLSHELRTPITSIRGWLEFLRQPDLDEETRQEALAAIDTSSMMQAKLIDDLLDVTRISRGKLPIERQVIDLQEALNLTVRQLMPHAEANGISIRTKLLPDRVMILADPRRMQQVFSNIVSNAIKFTPRGGLITLSVATDDDSATVTICDTGQGIEPELLARIFERYRQVKDAAHGGLGLGLAIVNHLVAEHGGTVWAESEGAGKGSTFYIRLPLHRQAGE